MTRGKLFNNKNPEMVLVGELENTKTIRFYKLLIDGCLLGNFFDREEWTFQADAPVEAGWYESEKYPLKSGGSPYEVFKGEVYLGGDRGSFPLNTKQIIQLGKLTRLGVGL